MLIKWNMPEMKSMNRPSAQFSPKPPKHLQVIPWIDTPGVSYNTESIPKHSHLVTFGVFRWGKVETTNSVGASDSCSKARVRPCCGGRACKR
jgi:hypothetical protein